MIYLLYTVHVIVSLFLILVVLLQQGKGADLSVFGGGSTQTAFGARGAASVLHKLTVACFIFFILTTLGIAIMKNTGASSSVVGDDPAPVEQEAAGEPEAVDDTEPATDPATEALPPVAPEAPADDTSGAGGDGAADPESR